VIATNIKEYFPPALRLLFTLLREKHDGDRVSLAPGDHDLAHLLLVNRGRRAPRAAIGPEDPAVLLMSGGTTGTPKGVVGTHGAYVISGMQLRIWNAAAHGTDPSKDVMFVPLPLFHCLPFARRLVAATTGTDREAGCGALLARVLLFAGRTGEATGLSVADGSLGRNEEIASALALASSNGSTGCGRAIATMPPCMAVPASRASSSGSTSR
jgi:hypothetical protein